jgi:5-methyltetrahydropteroyltriglutamate--homocysteine methyltransferase
VLFNELAVDGYFLNTTMRAPATSRRCDTSPRTSSWCSGSSRPSSHDLESKDDLKRRIDERRRSCRSSSSACRPSAGSRATVHGNHIARDAQAAKLRLVVETAQEVWGAT